MTSNLCPKASQSSGEQSGGYIGRRGAEGSIEEELDRPRARGLGEGHLEEVSVKSVEKCLT